MIIYMRAIGLIIVVVITNNQDYCLTAILATGLFFIEYIQNLMEICFSCSFSPHRSAAVLPEQKQES